MKNQAIKFFTFWLVTFSLLLASVNYQPTNASLLLGGAGETFGACSIQSDSDASNKGARYTSDGQSLRVASNSSINTVSTFSVGGWFNLDGVNEVLTKSIIAKFSNLNSDGFLLGCSAHVDYPTSNTKRIQFAIGTGSGLKYVQSNTFGDLSAGTWYFVVGTWDGTTLSVSINNGTADTSAPGASVGSNSGNLQVGSDTSFTNQSLKGNADSVFYAPSVLSGTVITSLYNSGAGKKWCQLTAAQQALFGAWYELKESDGSTRNDSTANANNLTDVSTVTQVAGKTSGACICP